jgi:RHS repeat-associated protein
VFYDLNGTKVNVTYDARNRLKRVNGHYNEYWYDVENNRIDMFYYSTNMIYTYDTSGGRNRLAWSMDHNYAETIYAYGADGLMWSLCNGTYRVYHYDYRGSVVAVTDINGTVTDTIRYNAYGSVYARTGSTNLIFGYNGRDGVLTDPNGLLYMRARYYDPLLKRFMNCDILTGSIANPSTLNLYAYVNGDPISYVDPFGMSAERSNNNNNGLIIYTGNIGMDGDTSYGDMSKDDLKSLKWISWWDFFFHNEYSHDAEFKNLLDTLSISENFMDGVVEEMYYHFLLGKGEDYENMWLTANVENHPKTQAYMNDFMKVFTKLISENNGNIQSFADSDDFHNMLKENGVFLSKYSYGGGLLDSDTYAGLTIAIHSWTANEVRVNWYKQEGNNYSGELNFRFTDVFGLNKEDIESYGYLQGFRSWFILQHYDEYAGRYIPFTTVVNIRYQFSGTLD